MTRVPPTVGYKNVVPEEFEQRKPNIVVFGSIRSNKGLFPALDIATAISESDNATEAGIRIQIIGTPFGDTRCVIGDIIRKRFSSKVISHVSKLYSEPNQLQKALKDILKAEVSVDDTGKLSIDTKVITKFLNQLLETEKRLKVKELLPIDLHIDLANDRIVELCQNSKYAVKYDNKGWANNASAHITPLVNGCILYTGCGVNTPKEVIQGQYKGAIVFLSNKYSLKDGVKLTIKQKKEKKEQQKFYAASTVQPENTDTQKKLITAKEVLKNILKREQDPSLNEETIAIAQELSKEFTLNIGVKYSKALTNEEERYKQCHDPDLQKKLIRIETDRLTSRLKCDQEDPTIDSINI